MLNSICKNQGGLMNQHGLSLLQLKVLKAMASGELLTRVKIKTQVNITKSTTLTRILSRLEAFGLIKNIDGGGFRITTSGVTCLKSMYTDPKDNIDEIIDSEAGSISVESDYTDSNMPNTIPESVIDDLEWLRLLSLEVAGRVADESDLNRVSIYSRAAADLATTYSFLYHSSPVMLSTNE